MHKLVLAGKSVLALTHTHTHRDEPTNDLDVETLRCLEEAIDNFAGSVLIISHDRWGARTVCYICAAWLFDCSMYNACVVSYLGNGVGK